MNTSMTDNADAATCLVIETNIRILAEYIPLSMGSLVGVQDTPAEDGSNDQF